MNVFTKLENGYLPDKYGKHAAAQFQLDDHPIVSFPIALESAPTATKSYALTFLDWDAIPVGGFCWIHWIACNIPAEITFIPENASALELIPMIQGSNSDWSPLAGSHTDPRIIHRYAGPYPPDQDHRYTLTVYALDAELDLKEGFYLNELLKHMEGHILAVATQHIMSRA